MSSAKEARVRNLFFLEGSWSIVVGAAAAATAKHLVRAGHFGPTVRNYQPLQAIGGVTGMWGLSLIYCSFLNSRSNSGLLHGSHPTFAHAHSSSPPAFEHNGGEESEGIAALWRETNTLVIAVNCVMAAALWVPALGLKRITPIGRMLLVGSSLQIGAFAGLQQNAGASAEHQQHSD